jgi:type VI secretion system protein ImpB
MSSQKFVGRNRAPRVQIEYDVEVYGAEKKIQLPFVMGVMADLTGNAGKAPAPINERKFLEVSAESLDDRMKGMQPGVSVTVANTLTGEGNLKAEMVFESLDDFSPAAIARKVPALKQLLEARQQLANLITYMDGKSGAEQLIAKVLSDPDALKALCATANPEKQSPAKAEPNPEASGA